MILTIGFSSAAALVFASMLHVYKYRGQARWRDLTEYLRKGWMIFAPLNCMLYLFTKKRARKAIMNINDFPELAPIQENWEEIRNEVLSLHNQNLIKNTNDPTKSAYYDIGFRTFYKYGWSKFYITWYGTTLESAARLCPKTVEVMNSVPAVNGAMFSILPPGGKLNSHLDPVACSLRYHLGLSTPNSDDCFINVDDTKYSWRDGEAFLFDETNLHYAKNDSDKERLILMCEIDRPLYFPGNIFNFFYKLLTRATVVPNMDGDSRGLVNAIFASISPFLRKTRELKETNRPLYKLIKYTVNTTAFLMSIGLIYGALKIIEKIIN